MQLFNKWLGLGVAEVLCALLAVGSVALAFLGPERSGALMARPPLLLLTGVLACGLAFSGVRAISRRRLDSALLHIGCSCVMAGWLAGQIAVRAQSPELPSSGYMALVDGFVTDELSDERRVLGKVPFTVRLMKFSIDRYEPSQTDRDEGRMPPVKEYCSLVLITEPGQRPYARKIRVNHPAYVRGYHIYQSSYRETVDADSRPVLVTILQFIRDPGLPAVYTGFALLLAGTMLFAARVLGGFKRLGSGEVSP